MERWQDLYTYIWKDLVFRWFDNVEWWWCHQSLNVFILIDTWWHMIKLLMLFLRYELWLVHTVMITHCKKAIYLNLYFKKQQFEHEGLCFVSEIWWFKSIWWMDISKKIESFSHIYPICKHTSHSAPIWTFAIYTQNMMLYFFERFHTFCDTKNTWATILRHIYYYMW